MTERLGFQAGAAPAAPGWGPPASPPAPQPSAGGWGAPAQQQAPAAAPAVQQSWGATTAPAPQPAAPAPSQGAWGAPQQKPQTGGEPSDPAAMAHFPPELQRAAASAGAGYSPGLEPDRAATAEPEKPKTTRTRKAAEKDPVPDLAPASEHHVYSAAAQVERQVGFADRATVNITFSGSADDVRAAMRALLG